MLGHCYKSSSLSSGSIFCLITCLAGTFTIVSNDSIRSSDFGFFVAKFIFIVFVEREILMARLELGPGPWPGVMIKAPACLISGLGLNPDTSRGCCSYWVRGGGKSSARSDRCTVLPISIHCTCSTMRFVVEWKLNSRDMQWKVLHLWVKGEEKRTALLSVQLKADLSTRQVVPRVPFNRTWLQHWLIPFLFLVQFFRVGKSFFRNQVWTHDGWLRCTNSTTVLSRVFMSLNVSETNFPKVLLEAGTSLSFFNFFGQNLFRSLISRMFSFF